MRQVLGLVDNDKRLPALGFEFPQTVGNGPHAKSFAGADTEGHIHRKPQFLGHILNLVLVAHGDLECVCRVGFHEFADAVCFAAPGFPDDHLCNPALLGIFQGGDRLDELRRFYRTPVGRHYRHADTACDRRKIPVRNGDRLVARCLILVNPIQNITQVRRTDIAQAGECGLRKTFAGDVLLRGSNNLIL